MPDVISLAGRPYVGLGYRWRDPDGLDAQGVHHTVSGGDWSGWALERSIDEEIAHALAIARYHDSLGLGGCGYTDLVFASGRIYNMGPPEQQRAGIGGGHNRHVYSWAFVGNLDLAWPSPAAMLSGGWLIQDIRQRLGKDQATMPARGHKEFVAGTSWATACPGKLYREWMPRLMEAANMVAEEEETMSGETTWAFHLARVRRNFDRVKAAMLEVDVAWPRTDGEKAALETALAATGTNAEADAWRELIDAVAALEQAELSWRRASLGRPL